MLRNKNLRKSALSIAPLFVLIAFASASTLWAQAERADHLTAIAPFVDGQTIAIVRIDLRKLDMAALKKQLLEPAARAEADRAQAATGLDKVIAWAEKLRGTTDGQIYAVCTLSNMLATSTTFNPEDAVIRSTFVVIPKLSAGATFDELNALLQSSQNPRSAKTNVQCRIVRGATVMAPPELLEQLTALQPANRTEFEAALDVGAEFPLGIAVVPPPIFARAAEEILLQKAPGSDQSWGSILGRGIRWFGAGAEPNLDKFSAKFVVQSHDAAAASKLAETMKQAIVTNLAAHPPSPNGAVNALLAAQLFSLVPEARNDQLVLQLTGDRATTMGILAKQLYVDSMESTWRRQSMNNLKMIGLALLNYEDKQKQLPDRAIRDKDGKPLLSWRVAVLPDLDEYGLGLYKQFRLDEPWDSEHNKKLIDQMPEGLRSPGESRLAPGYTRYLAAVGEQCAFPPDHGIKLAELADGTSQTIVVVEAAPDRAVIWTKPDDIEINLDDPLQGLGQMFYAVFGDGHVQGLSKELDQKILRAYFTRNGNDKIVR